MFKKIIGLTMVVLLTFSLSSCIRNDIGGGKSMGAFYSLLEESFKGSLTQEDLKNIAYYHNGGRVGNESKIDENFVPIAKNPETLNKEIDNRIRQDYLNNIKKKDVSATIDGVFIHAYYGIYNGYVAIVISDNYTVFAQGTMPDIIVDGIKFSFHHGLLLWKAD